MFSRSYQIQQRTLQKTHGFNTLETLPRTMLTDYANAGIDLF